MDFSRVIVLTPFTYLRVLRRSIGKARTVLDLGCGDGSLMKTLAQGQNWEITGTDIYEKWLKQARRIGVYHKLIAGDVLELVRKLTRQRKKFDVVFCSQTIEHLERKQGEKLLDIVEKIAIKRIVFGTPRDFMEQPEVFIKDNPYQYHKSGWSINDFRNRGYKVYGVGFSPVWSEKGLGRVDNKLVYVLATMTSFIFAPLVYFFPKLGAGILAIKEKEHEQ